ncbi:hypothetical protein GJAV_G00139400 [Gymnothorax javanicus]|nr:hypothetical protein GJAV_G00139400 [Gymnothorax javanicus]
MQPTFEMHPLRVDSLSLLVRFRLRHLRGQGLTRMEKSCRTFSDVKSVVLTAHYNEAGESQIRFYNSWAETYDQDVAILDFKAPILAAECLSNSFEGDREKALVLDVGCGTGLASAELQKLGFQQFVGVDGSEKMLAVAKRKGIYQELKQCILGTTALPFQAGMYDAVIVAGALGSGLLDFTILRELCQVTKPGGCISMSTRADICNKEYKNCLERLLSEMEKEGLWKRISVLEVENWELGVTKQETGYIPGVVYVYRKSQK